MVKIYCAKKMLLSSVKENDKKNYLMQMKFSFTHNLNTLNEILSSMKMEFVFKTIESPLSTTSINIPNLFQHLSSYSTYTHFMWCVWK